MYSGGFAARLKGARVLELGAGDGLNALVMAALGADVTCIDISDETTPLVRSAADALGLSSRVHPICGDVTETAFEVLQPFHLVVGKAFLAPPHARARGSLLSKVAGILQPGGEARFVEPAVNSPWLDTCRSARRRAGPSFPAQPGGVSSLSRGRPAPGARQQLGALSPPGRTLLRAGGHRPDRRPRAVRTAHAPRRLASAVPPWRARVERWFPYAMQLKLARAQTIMLTLPRPLPMERVEDVS